ncbi:MAG TPA: DUF58 domain-containing protein [Chthoniobacterales bacterium]
MVITDPDELFDAGLLQRYESLSLLARKLVRGRMRAERRSVRRGASVEFAEYRPFVAGDDYRYIDWHAFARWRQLVLKLFIEEEDLHVHLLLDCSQSMDWGAPVKFDQARRLIAGLAYIALANLDRASIVPLGLEAPPGLPPSRGRERFLQIIRYLARCPVSSGVSRLEDRARAWLASRPRRGSVVWVSDLLGRDPEDALRALDRLRHARHEVAIIHLLDPSETLAGDPGEYEFEDCESGQVRRVVVDQAAARAFRQRVADYRESLSRYGKKHQIPILSAQTTDEVAGLLGLALRWQ